MRPDMNDDEFCAALLSAGRAERPRAEVMEGTVSAALRAAACGAPVASSASGLGLATKITFLALVATHAPAPPPISMSPPPIVAQTSAAPAPVPFGPRDVVAVTDVTSALEASIAPVHTATPSAAPVVRRAPPTKPGSKLAVAKPATPVVDPLLESVERLEQAREAIAAKNLAGAEGLLGSGVTAAELAPEAELLRIDLLVRQQRIAEARAAVAAFTAAHPQSPLTIRARRLLPTEGDVENTPERDHSDEDSP